MRFASWSWGAAGFIFALAPVLAALLLWLQYRSLRGNAYRLADLTALVAPSDTIDLTPYIAEFERAEAWILGTAGWMLVVILVLYLLAAAAIVAAYLTVSTHTAQGSGTARALGTVLSILSSIAVLLIWQTFAAISWLPVDALWANHLGLVIVALQILGIVLVWLPASNRFVRESAAAQAMRFNTQPLMAK